MRERERERDGAKRTWKPWNDGGGGKIGLEASGRMVWWSGAVGLGVWGSAGWGSGPSVGKAGSETPGHFQVALQPHFTSLHFTSPAIQVQVK